MIGKYSTSKSYCSTYITQTARFC